MNNAKILLRKILFITYAYEPLVRIAERSEIPLATLYDLISGYCKKPRGKMIYRPFWLYCNVITDAQLHPHCRRYYPVLSCPVDEIRKPIHLPEQAKLRVITVNA